MGKPPAYLIAPLLLSVLLFQGSASKDIWIRTSEPEARQLSESPTGPPGSASTAFEPSLTFIENVGQYRSAARFYVRDADGKSFWLGEDSIWITVFGGEARPPVEGKLSDPFNSAGGQSAQPSAAGQGVNIRLRFPGMNPQPRLLPFDPRSSTVNYLHGNDPENWYPDVPTWTGVRYVDIYPGIDLEVTSRQGQITMRVASRSGANLDDIVLKVEGHDGMTLARDTLILRTVLGDIGLRLLQVEGDTKVDVPNPRLEDSIVYSPFAQPANPGRGGPSNLRVAQQANSSPGSIHYSTYLGGIGSQFGQAVLVDSAGAAYIAGATYSADFPTTPGAFQTDFGGGRQPSDAYVAKFTADGSDLIYATFLGGSGDDRAHGADLDTSGAVYVTGHTNSADFPTTAGSYQSTIGGGLCGIGYPCFDGFVTAESHSGSPISYRSRS